jgi:hypothetical protein
MAKTKEEAVEVSIRRSPKYLNFIILGAILGIVAAFILNANVPEASRSAEPILGYLIAFLAGAGAGLGIITAVVLDRLLAARAKVAKATKLEG